MAKTQKAMPFTNGAESAKRKFPSHLVANCFTLKCRTVLLAHGSKFPCTVGTRAHAPTAKSYPQNGKMQRRGFAQASAQALKLNQYKFPLKAEKKAVEGASLENGVRVATVEDFQSPVASLGVVLPCGPASQQGRQEVGMAQFLKLQAFKSSHYRSTIRLTREADLTGMSLSCTLLPDRTSLLLRVDCLRDDVPDSVQILAEAVDSIVRRDNEHWGVYSREFVRKTADWKESIRQLNAESELVRASPSLFSAVVMDEVYKVAYNGQGLGMPMYPLVEDVDIQHLLGIYVPRQLRSEDMSVVGYGIGASSLKQLLSQSHFANDAAGSSAAATDGVKVYGGEYFSSMLTPNGDAHLMLAFPSVPSEAYYCALVLKNLLGNYGRPVVSYGSNGSGLLGQHVKGNVSAGVFVHEHPGRSSAMLGLYVQGGESVKVSEALKVAVQQLKSAKDVKREEFTAAVSQTKLQLASLQESFGTRILELHRQLASDGKASTTDQLLERVSNVSQSDVKKLAEALLKNASSGSVLVGFGDAYGGFARRSELF